MRKKFAALLGALLAGMLLLPCACAEKRITLTFTGDVTLGGEESKKKAEMSFNWYAENEGYDWFFRNVKPLFEQDDLTIVNLEGTLTDSGKMENTKKTYRFRGPKDYVNILTGASIEAVNIANNHTMDFGTQGYRSTVRTLEEAGIQYCGNDYHFIYEKDGIKIAFFGLVSSKVAPMKDNVAKAVKKLKEQEGVNAVVVIFHAGMEYNPHRTAQQEKYAAMARKNFQADLVIMHHPHVIQGIDILDNRYVCYSLGNFCFGGNMSIRALETMVVRAEMVFEDDGTYKGQQLRLYPAHIASSALQEGDASDFQPKLVTGEEALQVLELVQNDTAFELGLYDEDEGCMTLKYLTVPDEDAVPVGT